MKTTFTKVRKYLDGKKTYIGLAVATVYAFLVAAKIVDNNEYVWGLIVLWTGVSFRAALSG